MQQKLSKALTWDELANEFDKHSSGRPARTLPMDQVFQMMKNRTKEFHVDPKEGTIHKILEN